MFEFTNQNYFSIKIRFYSGLTVLWVARGNGGLSDLYGFGRVKLLMMCLASLVVFVLHHGLQYKGVYKGNKKTQLYEVGF
ncbi:hypothetical protein [Aestuariivivens sediminicola]|uniref:hypothetical protein n=1 Tax=Aestuariivivens sediminicola TaxID=2913560 RepID=UPI001F5729FA|nr:hypothetical protein [Aestuariivivens sediminicola]